MDVPQNARFRAPFAGIRVARNETPVSGINGTGGNYIVDCQWLFCRPGVPAAPLIQPWNQSKACLLNLRRRLFRAIKSVSDRSILIEAHRRQTIERYYQDVIDRNSNRCRDIRRCRVQPDAAFSTGGGVCRFVLFLSGYPGDSAGALPFIQTQSPWRPT